MLKSHPQGLNVELKAERSVIQALLDLVTAEFRVPSKHSRTQRMKKNENKVKRAILFSSNLYDKTLCGNRI
ncbi:hypothetical protein Y1Q_0018853 [Alligator mississippiensis]|uniref:Uncharacterized protein n=1 Tax=Alligator mississippiensis TaxID=8496 RepID=A0A151M2W5_ALLMI|nr:hypothetical protein Y1Q_0018853 [Alligator mississippiensis]